MEENPQRSIPETQRGSEDGALLALNNDPWGHKVMAAPKGQILHNPNSCVSLWGWRCPDDRGFLQTVKQFGPVCAGEGKIQRPMLCPVMCESKIGRVSVDCLNDGLTEP